MQWVAISVTTTCEAQDAVCQILYEAGAKGAVVEGDRIIKITVYFPSGNGTDSIISHVKEKINGLSRYGINPGKTDIVMECIDDKDWAGQWKKSYKPIRITPSLVVKPTWRDMAPDPDDIVIELDPGMAFGTGTHFTTQSCLTLLEKYIKQGCSVLDVGTGAGILAIAAAKLGASNVLALDIDDVAITVAKQNIEQNDVEDRVDAKNGSPDNMVLGRYDIIVMNIVAEVIVNLIPCLSKTLKEQGLLIVAGIIPDRIGMIEEAFIKEGMAVVETLRDENWITFVYGKGRDNVA